MLAQISDFWNKNKAILSIVIFSLFLNSFWLQWGLPQKWHPDEHLYVDEVVRMAKASDLRPEQVQVPTLQRYLLLILLAPYFIAVKFVPGLHFSLDKVYLFSRFFSSLIAALITCLVYIIAKTAGSRRSGLLAALLCSLSMGFVNIAHFAVPDILMIFFIMLALIFFMRIISFHRNSDYCYAGIFSGLAIASKYNAVILLPLIIVAYLLQEGSKRVYSEPGINRYTVLLPLFFVAGSFCILGIFPSIISMAALKALSLDKSLSHSTAGFLAYFNKGFLFLGIIINLAVLLSIFWRKFSNGVVNVCSDGRVFIYFCAVAASFLAVDPYVLLDFHHFCDGIIFVWRMSQGLIFFPARHPVQMNVGLLIDACGWPLFLLCLSGIAWGIIKALRGNRFFALLLAWIILFIIFMFPSRTISLRYLVPLIPVMVIFGALLLNNFWDLRQPFKTLGIAVFGFVLIYASFYTFTLENMFRYDTRYTAGEWIANNVPESSSIVAYSKLAHYLPAFPKSCNTRLINLMFEEKMDADFLVLTSFDYQRYFDHPEEFPAKSAYLSSLVEGRSTYRLEKKFEFKGLFNLRPEFVAPVILIYRK